MAVVATITKRPILTIGSPAVKMRWTAAWNPVVYEFNVSGVTDLTTYLTIEVYEFGSNLLLSRDNYSLRNQNLTIDISGILSSYLYSLYDPFSSASQNCKDLGSTIKAFIKYSVNTSTTIGVTVSDESNFVYVTNSAKQPLDLYGQNMREYTPSGQLYEDGAKFLTKFSQPVLFPGFPFTISWIFSELIMGHELKLVEDKLDINKQSIADSETSLDITHAHFINHLKLEDYPSNIDFVDIHIQTGDPAAEVYVYEGYVEDGYTEVR